MKAQYNDLEMVTYIKPDWSLVSIDFIDYVKSEVVARLYLDFETKKISIDFFLGITPEQKQEIMSILSGKKVSGYVDFAVPRK